MYQERARLLETESSILRSCFPSCAALGRISSSTRAAPILQSRCHVDAGASDEMPGRGRLEMCWIGAQRWKARQWSGGLWLSSIDWSAEIGTTAGLPGPRSVAKRLLAYRCNATGDFDSETASRPDAPRLSARDGAPLVLLAASVYRFAILCVFCVPQVATVRPKRRRSKAQLGGGGRGMNRSRRCPSVWWIVDRGACVEGHRRRGEGPERVSTRCILAQAKWLQGTPQARAPTGTGTDDEEKMSQMSCSGGRCRDVLQSTFSKIAHSRKRDGTALSRRLSRGLRQASSAGGILYAVEDRTVQRTVGPFTQARRAANETLHIGSCVAARPAGAGSARGYRPSLLLHWLSRPGIPALQHTWPASTRAWRCAANAVDLHPPPARLIAESARWIPDQHG